MSKFDTFKAITGCEFKVAFTKKDKLLKMLNSDSFKKTIISCSPLFKLIFLKGFGLDKEFLNNPLLSELLSATDEEEIETLIENSINSVENDDNIEDEETAEVEAELGSEEEPESEEATETSDETLMSSDFIPEMTNISDTQELDNIYSILISLLSYGASGLSIFLKPNLL